jgi:putative transposase
MANRPPRFPDFPYAGFNRYFLTVCVDQRVPVFLDLALGDFVAMQFLRFGTAFGFEVIAYVVMPDHIHLLAAGQLDDSLLKPYMHRFKQETGYEWKHRRHHRTRLWQEGYYDRILRDNDPTEGVVRYILENPVRAGLVDDARAYPLIGAMKYNVDELLESAMLWRPPWK